MDQRLTPFLRFDSHYYLSVATYWYGAAPPPIASPAYRAAFFPLYPALASVVTLVMRDPAWAALLVSNCAFLAALAFVYAVGRRHLPDRSARAAIWLLAFYPWSIFFSYPYSESIALLALAAAFWLMEKERWWPVGFVAIAAAMSRFPGVLLGLAPAAEAAWRLRHGVRAQVKQLAPLALASAGSLIGLAIVAVWLRLQMGDALGFFHGQQLWIAPPRNPLFPLAVLARAIAHANLTDSQAFGVPVLGAFVASAAWALVRLPWRLSAFSVALLGLGAYQSWQLHQYYSLPRYLMIGFPSFFAFATALASPKRPAWLLPLVLSLSAGLMGLYASLFSSWHFVG